MEDILEKREIGSWEANKESIEIVLGRSEKGLVQRSRGYVSEEKRQTKETL